MRLTVSILCHNYGRFLGNAIEGVLNQQGNSLPVEILVLDDGSIDNTPEICEQYRGRIRVVRSANQGFGATLTKAIEMATGDYVCLLDADDYFLPEKLRFLEPHILKGERVIYHAQQFVSESGVHMPGDPLQHGGNTSTLCVKRQDALTLLPVENELSFHALGEFGRKVVLPEALSCYRFHGSSMTQRTIAGKWNTYLAGVAHNLARLFEQRSFESFPWMNDLRQKQWLNHYYHAQAYYNELEAALELRRIFPAWVACWRMLFHAARSHHRITVFHLKMVIKTIMLRPSFPKSTVSEARTSVR